MRTKARQIRHLHKAGDAGFGYDHAADDAKEIPNAQLEQDQPASVFGTIPVNPHHAPV
jgi:hypothetical protein